ncbi:MAG TPA: ABC transporter ATP-binding protein [Candidatus Blautia merdigallinarum]|uniref:ABC transporter ATP-binding protein n=1 Tax=Candidatus Blautia merdigallinarum TaxID=2838495 RepID=A0A9D2N4D1_9FIRM|nr:ABC transporter ATP-binding protein [Candidatus Blautia merdigallinarum]
MDTVLDVTGLNKSYDSFSLKDVSFSLPEGCITGFIGINGAGKTTTLRSILGLAKGVTGSIRFFGMDMEENEWQIKDRIGVVLDSGGFYEDLSLNEMKKILAPAYSSWCEEDYRSYLERFSLNPKEKIKNLSRGMKVKYALALALSHKAELLIMDEPTSGLDPLSRSQLLNVLRDYMEQGGKGVLFSTHITSDLDKIADMLIMINQGRIVFQGEKDALMDRYRIIKGRKRELNENIRSLFLSIHETDFGFTGMTSHVSQIQKLLPNILLERPTVEDIMLSLIEGGKENAAELS